MKYEWTRIHEPKHFHPERKETDKTIIIKEYSSDADDNNQYYPVRDPESMKAYEQYKELAKTVPNVIFGGRLGEYQYYDMDKVILSALNKFKEIS